jgi:aryl-alcohol dehydrogenase-like predicted oxidoreductase/predicted kinase
MRMSTDADRDEAVARETIKAALASGVTVFDTAHAYGQGNDDLGHNERLLAGALRDTRARVVTKGGMTRPGGAWIPDGRAKAILDDCEASLAALDGLPIDLYLIHAPDPRRPWSTSVRALARLLDDGLVRHIGVSNVNRKQLDEAIGLAPITAVEVALSPHDDRAIRGGILEQCTELGIAVIAHSPLGGPRRAGSLAHRPGPLGDVARTFRATPAQIALAWLLDLDPTVVAIPGARRPQNARSAARAATLALDAESRAALRRALGEARRDRAATRAARAPNDAEVILLMGVPGAGKTRVAEQYAARGYVRLNRDERGGPLRELAHALDEQLLSGGRRVVLDNTYLTRAARSYAIDTASRHGFAVRCVWLRTPLAQAQVNLVERLLDQFGALPTPEQLRALARRQPGVLAPTSQMRAFRELEPPSLDEGFARVETIEFARAPSRRARAGVFVAAAAIREQGWQGAVAATDAHAPHLLFDWSPGEESKVLESAVKLLAGAVAGPIQAGLCPHPGGPPTCWCRPPLPGLPLAFARAHDVDPARSILIGTGPAHRGLAAALGARYVGV